MGLLDAMQPQAQQPQGGLLSGMEQAPAQGGLPPMPPELVQAIQQMKGASPEEREAFIREIVGKIQGMPKPPEQVEQAIQQFMQAMGE